MDLPQGHLLLGLALVKKGKESLGKKLFDEAANELDEAAREYKEGIRIRPELLEIAAMAPPQFWVAWAYYAKSRQDKKVAEDAIRELKEAIRVKPGYAPAHGLLAAIYYERGEKELARLELEETIRLDPNVPESHAFLGAIYKENVNCGEEKWNDEAIEKGIKAYKEVIRLAPENAEAHRVLGRLYRYKGLYDLEVFEAKEALRLEKSAENHRALGSAYIWKGDYDQALKELREALSLKPNDGQAHHEIAFAYHMQNRFEDAEREYRKYIELEETNSVYPILYPLLWQHLSMKGMGKDAEALKLLEEFAKGFKGKEWELHLLSYHQGRLTESELISKAKNECDRCEAFYYVGSQYLLKGDRQKAKEFFQKTMDTKVYRYYEYAAACARLKQLGVE